MNSTKNFEQQFKARAISLEVKPIGLDCVRCWDCGFIWVDCEGAAVWAYCRCKAGKQKHEGLPFKLPLYDYQMESLFKHKTFPEKAFIPSSFDSFKQGLENKISLFKADLRLSERFWQTGGKP